MKNFLEQARGVTKTLLAYGNVNDLIIDHDLLASPFSVYLVRLLKAQGYQHIVFYGDEGNHGAFCLDAESADMKSMSREDRAAPPQSRLRISQERRRSRPDPSAPGSESVPETIRK